MLSNVSETRVVVSKSYQDVDSGDWILEGIASDGSVDDDGEVIDHATMDVTRLTGVNWNHKNDPAYQIGEVIQKILNHKGLHVKVKLYKDMEVAQDVWKLAKAMRNGGSRRLEFSLQGRAQKVGNKLVNGQFNKVSICITGVNRGTYADIAKSFDIDENTFNTIKDTLFEEASVSMKKLFNDIENIVSKIFNSISFTNTETNSKDKDETQEHMKLDKEKTEAIKKAMDALAKAMEEETADDNKTVEKSVDAEALAAKVTADLQGKLEEIQKGFENSISAKDEAHQKEVAELKAKLEEVNKSLEAATAPGAKGIPSGGAPGTQFITKSYSERFPVKSTEKEGKVFDVNLNKEGIKNEISNLVIKAYNADDKQTAENLTNAMTSFTVTGNLNEDALQALSEANVTITKQDVAA